MRCNTHNKSMRISFLDVVDATIIVKAWHCCKQFGAIVGGIKPGAKQLNQTRVKPLNQTQAIKLKKS